MIAHDRDGTQCILGTPLLLDNHPAVCFLRGVILRGNPSMRLKNRVTNLHTHTLTTSFHTTKYYNN